MIKLYIQPVLDKNGDLELNKIEFNIDEPNKEEQEKSETSNLLLSELD
jgi:hypothetical protein